MDIKLIGIWNDSASDEPFFNGLPLIGVIYEGHFDYQDNSWYVISDVKITYLKFPKEFLMPLAEWREQQINSILE